MAAPAPPPRGEVLGAGARRADGSRTTRVAPDESASRGDLLAVVAEGRAGDRRVLTARDSPGLRCRSTEYSQDAFSRTRSDERLSGESDTVVSPPPRVNI